MRFGTDGSGMINDPISRADVRCGRQARPASPHSWGMRPTMQQRLPHLPEVHRDDPGRERLSSISLATPKPDGTVVNLPRSGRPTKIIPRAQRRLIQEVTKHPTTTSKELQASLGSGKAPPCPNYIKQAPPCPDYIKQAPPHLDYIKQAPPCPDYIKQAPPHLDYIKQAPPHLVYIKQAPPHLVYIKQAPPHLHYIKQAPPHLDYIRKAPPRLHQTGSAWNRGVQKAVLLLSACRGQRCCPGSMRPEIGGAAYVRMLRLPCDPTLNTDCTLLDGDRRCCSWDLLESFYQFGGHSP
ncbi:hypothetical protein P4O66_004156 [Electrophorus voltai]|uniref:Uncharacterized protein n=1 Tax=Electrophorus voltai TaxID=2609070 RepID=A0AAD9E2A2_9TELE|nr:hypothetical protein P4O66_004156 [Electrophorus voltai]